MPNIATDAIFLSCGIDARYNRDVVTCNIPGEFMKSYMDDIICVRLTGPVFTLTTQVFPKQYEIYIIYEKVIPVIYLRLKIHFVVLSRKIYYSGRTSLVHYRTGDFI